MNAEAALGALREVGSVACFRALPFAVVLLAATATPWRLRIATALVYAGLAVALQIWNLLAFGWIAAIYAYFAAIGSLIPRATELLRDRRITRPALLIACAFAFLLLPAVLVPGAGKPVALILGWDLVLSAYSYIVDVADSDERPALRPCLFFLLVNPVLVYAQRGERLGPPRFDRRGSLRAGLGLLVLGFGALLPRLSEPFETQLAGTAPLGGTLPAFALTLALAAQRFFLVYVQHSGLASLQIGLIRQLGYDVPERFKYPLLASGPLDFWRRWNVYVGNWAQRYVLFPVTLELGRGRSSPGRRAAQIAGVLAAFALIGLMHDAYRYADTFSTAGRASAVFIASAVLVLIWAGARALRAPVAVARAGRWLGRIPFWAATLALFGWYVQ